MQVKNISTVVFLLIPVLMQGCFWFTSKHDGDRMKSEIETIRKELTAMKEQDEAAVKKLEQKLDLLTAKAGEIEKDVDIIRRTDVANVGIEQDAIKTRIQELKGQIEELQHKLDGLSTTLGKVQVADPVAQQGRKDQKLSEIIRPDNAKEYFKLGTDLFGAGQWEASRIIFTEYIVKFKGDKKCADARFQIAEAFSREGKFQNAILEFQKVVTEYPKSDRIEETLYRLAVSFADVGLFEDSKKFLADFVKTFPNSKYAPKAKKKLAELSRVKK